MTKLEDVCGSDLSSAPLEQLRDSCQDFGQAFGLSGLEIGLIVLFAVLGLFWLLALRHRQGKSADVVAGNAIEGMFYGAIGAYGGTTAGLIAAELASPAFFAAVLIVLSAFVGWFVIAGIANGDGDAGGKVGAAILGLLLLAVPVTLIVSQLALLGDGPKGDSYETYLNVAPLLFGALGALDGILAAVFRGPHWAAGWALVFVNSSWGFLGNVLGLATHVGSYLCWTKHGDPQRENRKAYTLYRNGLTLKPDPGNRFAFTQGWVVSCDRPGDIEAHEAWHVAQHFLFGPVYVISHGAWDLVGGFYGLLKGAFGSLGVQDAITRMAYLNNPWEIWAYETHTGHSRVDTDDLIFASPGKYIFTVCWILAWIGITIALVAVWIG